MTRVALLQARTGIDPEANAKALVAAVEEAAAGGAAMLFTPEMSGLLDRDKGRAAVHLRPAEEDPVLSAVRAAAARAGIWVHLGSLAVRRADEPRLANRAFLIGADGEIRATYDKLHLFDVDLPTGESWRESASYAPGEAAVVAETPVGPLGLSVCYDLRFPDLYRALTDAGAKVIAIPAAFTVPTGRAHWDVLVRARAIENQVFVIAAGQVGRHPPDHESYGHSMIADPWGVVLASAGDESEKVVVADLDLDTQAETRRKLPSLANRRPGAYRWPEPALQGVAE